jgi:hypothetical protein
MEAWFRAYAPPVITRLERDRVMFDVRTIQEREFEIVARAIKDLAVAEPLERSV